MAAIKVCLLCDRVVSSFVWFVFVCPCDFCVGGFVLLGFRFAGGVRAGSLDIGCFA
jgi:hypothetical protein